jgi:anti-sigma factor RsiW
MNGPPRCDPEPIFELADGSLGQERETEVRAHLRSCAACRTLYEKELRLNASLGSLAFLRPLRPWCLVGPTSRFCSWKR